jgi:NifB/MoaA-like Fe-S oxidoreductase
MSGLVKAIEQHSVAERMGLRAGDLVFSINGHTLRDVIDAQFYGADDRLDIEFERDGVRHTTSGMRDFGQALGIEFDHPTFDIDIRRCNNLCPFCFVLQNAPKMRRTLYIKDDDYRYSFLFGHFVTLTNLSDED